MSDQVKINNTTGEANLGTENLTRLNLVKKTMNTNSLLMPIKTIQIAISSTETITKGRFK